MKHFRIGIVASSIAVLCSLLLAACSPTVNVVSETRNQQTVQQTAVRTEASTETSMAQTATPTRERILTLTPTSSRTNSPTSTPKATRIRSTATRVVVATRTPTRKANTTLNCKRILVGGTGTRLPTIQLSDLLVCRPQARTTLRQIRQNGPFRYGQDDATFQNRERHLPAAPRDTYREYTVITPEESDRGARRFITSGNASRQPADYDTLYFTDDHYDTFWVVKEQ